MRVSRQIINMYASDVMQLNGGNYLCEYDTAAIRHSELRTARTQR